MTLLSGSDNTILKDFLSMSHWQTLVAVVVFYAILIPYFIYVTKYKVKFIYRVLGGLGLGLAFGIVIQAILGFPADILKYDSKNGSWNFNTEKYEWVNQMNTWLYLFKNIFINGIMLLTIPVVFMAIFRVTAKPGNRGMARMTGKGIAILLVGVAVAFTVTFWIGIAINVGGGTHLTQGSADSSEAHKTKAIPEIIWGYVSQNFFAAIAGSAIIPVIVIAALIGGATKFVRRKHPDAMNKLAYGVDRAWDIVMSLLTTFMKIMPAAVMAMISTAITSRPIGALASIGKTIGLGYLGILCALVYMTLVLFLSGVKVGAWWKGAWRPLIQGFATQSSNATLPVTMDTMENDMKMDEKVVSMMGPLSTSMGLIACAGVQSGLVCSFLWTGADQVSSGFGGGIFVFFIMGLVVCLIASLGIAGIPGTATVVTTGVLGGLGYSTYFSSVYAVVGALDGLFDMGRTGANIIGGVFATTLTAKSEGLIQKDSTLLSKVGLEKQQFIYEHLDANADRKEFKQAAFNARFKRKRLLEKELAGFKSQTELPAEKIAELSQASKAKYLAEENKLRAQEISQIAEYDIKMKEQNIDFKRRLQEFNIAEIDLRLSHAEKPEQKEKLTNKKQNLQAKLAAKEPVWNEKLVAAKKTIEQKRDHQIAALK